jgi:hypothetical protein
VAGHLIKGEGVSRSSVGSVGSARRLIVLLRLSEAIRNCFSRADPVAANHVRFSQSGHRSHPKFRHRL